MPSATSDDMTIDDLIENFSLLEDWDDRYRYVIELGRGLPLLAESEHNDANKVQGCASQVWLATSVAGNGGGPVLTFLGDSDAHIVRGLIAILFIAYSASPPKISSRPTPSRCSSAWGCASTLRRNARTDFAPWSNDQDRCASGARQRVSAPGFMARSRLIAAFAAVYLIWGSTFLALALGLQSIPPLLLMGARSIAAGPFCSPSSRFAVPDFRRARSGVRIRLGLLLFVGCHGTLAYAQQYVPSGLAVMLATVPFWIVLLNVSAPSDLRAKLLTFAGLLPGLAGVALIAWPGDSGAPAAIDPLMLLLLLASAFFWACRLAGLPAPASRHVGDLVGGHAARLRRRRPARRRRPRRGARGFSPGDVSAISWAGLSYLIGAGSVIGFTAYIWLLDHAPGPLVATYTFVNPIIAVILGWRFLDERPTPQMLVGTALVVGSVAAVWRLNSRPAPGERSALADQAQQFFRRLILLAVLLAAAALLTEAHLLGELGTGGGVIRRHHRIVRRQTPLLAILLRCHLVLRAQVALQRLEFLAVLETHDVVGRDRLLDRDGGFQRLQGKLALPARYARQGGMHLIDQRRQISCRHRIIADIGRHDFGRQLDEGAT